MGGVARLVMAMDGGRLGGYSVLVFTGWDHGLQDERAARVKHNNLRYRLQVSATSCSVRQNRKTIALNSQDYECLCI